MAIYHLHAKVIQRSKGENVIAASAYRRAVRLHDLKEERDWDFSSKRGVIYSQITVPENAPAWVNTLAELQTEHPEKAAAQLWNALDAAEKRVDSQLARELEFSLPIELNEVQAIALARAFIVEQCVGRGMIADWSVHWDEGNPHVHVLLTMRELTDTGFGRRMLEWNSKGLLQTWRQQWAEYANVHLHLNHHAVKIDHRSYQAQGIDLMPGLHEGNATRATASRGKHRQRLEDANEIRRFNLARLSEEAEIVFRKLSNASDIFTQRQLATVLGSYLNDQGGFSAKASEKETGVLKPESIERLFARISEHESVFTENDIAKAVAPFTQNAEAFAKAVIEIKKSDQLIALGAGDDGRDRFTTRDLFHTENRIQDLADTLQARTHRSLSESQIADVLAQNQEKTGQLLTEEQKTAVSHLLEPARIACLVGRAGTGKSFCLGAAKSAWESQGLEVHGIALSGIAADGLSNGTGIASRTIESFRYRVQNKQLTLNTYSVVVMDEAGMTDSRSMLAVLEMIEEANAKLVLVGDPVQLQPVGPGATFRALVERLGFVEIQTVYRQSQPWQRQATVDFSKGEMEKGLSAYQSQNCLHVKATSEAAIDTLLTDWQTRCQEAKDVSQVLLIAHRNADVDRLNRLARTRQIEAGQLSEGYSLQTTQGELKIAAGDRILFLKNDRTLGVSNGRFATVTSINFRESGAAIAFNAKLDGSEELITINPHQYADFTYGYAGTVHKTQGMTVDHSLVYAGGKGWNRHLTYVALSRHRQTCHLYADRQTYGDDSTFVRRLSRWGLKDSVLDFPLAFAMRRGIDPENRRQPLALHLASRLTHLKQRLTEQLEQWLRPDRALEREAEAARKQAEIEKITQRREDATFVAAYVDARRDVGHAWQALQAQLKTLGISQLSHPKVRETAEYRAFESAQHARNRHAHAILQDLKRYEKALTIYAVEPKALKQHADRHVGDQKNRARQGNPNRPHSPRLDINRLRADLNARADSVAEHYLGQPKSRQGQTFRYGRHQGSLVVTIKGTRQGLWYDFQLNKGGDMLSLIQASLPTSDFKAVLQEATRFLGGDSLYQQSSLKTPSVSEESLKKPNRNETQEKIRKAQAIYQGTQPLFGTVAERYLREHRGITGNLEGKTLRYHPQLKNWMTGSTHPALVVIARDENDRFCGLQAIFLDTNTAKKATELGHHVKLSRGLIGGGALIHAGISSDHVALAEGPETALSIAQAQPDWHVYVTFGVSNVANVRFPDATTRVVICADNDGRDSGTAKSIEQSTQKLSQRGIHVWVAEPQKPLGQTKWDFNDALLTQGVESIKNDLDRAKRHNRHVEKEPFDQNIQKSPSSLPESSLVVKTPSDSIRETPPETMHTLLRRYVDMELEQTRLVNAMHTARLEDSPSANEICAQAIAHSAAIERFAEKAVKNPELQSILETLQNIKPESVAQRGGFSDIGERLHRGEFAQEDVHVLATKLRSKAMEQSRTQAQERSREGRGR